MKRRYDDDQVEIGTRLKRFFVMMGVVFAITVGVVVSQNLPRLSTDSLAMSLGLALGCGVGLVPVALIVVLLRVAVRYLDERDQRRAARQQPLYGQPPVIVMPPYPQFQQPWPDMGQGQIVHAGPREFTVIGDGE